MDTHLQESLTEHLRTDFASIRWHQSVDEAIESLRVQSLSDRITYLYVTDEEGALQGIVSTRQLLTASPDRTVDEIMSREVVSLSVEDTVYEACEYFVLYKYLAIPVVDKEMMLRGIVDISMFTDELLDFGERKTTDDIFESIGFRFYQVRHATPARAWRYRFPWLLATITSGTACALLAAHFEATLAESILLAFFITLVLGLGESVSIQSMTVTLQRLHVQEPDWKWFGGAFLREAVVAMMLGLSAGMLVGGLVWGWHGDLIAAGTIGSSISLALLSAALLGLSIPVLLHALRLDPKIAAGPVTLALTDICTLLFYFGLATWWM